MSYIIIGAIVIIIAILLIRLVFKLIAAILRLIKKHIKKILFVFAAFIAAYFLVTYPTIRIPFAGAVSICIIIALLIKVIRTLRGKKNIRDWLKKEVPVLTQEDADNIVLAVLQDVEAKDRNAADYKFNYSKIPLGRANAFLNYHNSSIENEEVLYFSPVPSVDPNEMREYGLAITRNGLYISENSSEGTHIPFAGLWGACYNTKDGILRISWINEASLNLKYRELHRCSTLPLSRVASICERVVVTQLNHVLYKHEILSADDAAEKAEEQFIQQHKTASESSIIETAAIFQANNGLKFSFGTPYSEVQNMMNSYQGHGYAAEYANNTIDRLRLRTVEASERVNGVQVKNGYDRKVSGIEIQTKYYQYADSSIKAAFDNGKPRYLDQAGKMMQIEVPRDQYAKAVDYLQKRINDNKISGLKPGDDARKYVRKGYFTYDQAVNISKAGTIESVGVDVLTGAIFSTSAAGITFALSFGIAMWNGQTAKDAARGSVQAGLKVLGKGAFIYTLAMQLSRRQFAVPFTGLKYGTPLSKDNPIFTLSKKMADNIKSSKFAQGSIGKKLGLPTITEKALISNSVLVIITFGPDICRALMGRISIQQLIKNSAIGAAGLGGAALGQMLIPVPILGAMIGGAVSGFVVKNILDQFIEDDAKKMFQIFKEEFLDIVTLSYLTKAEFEIVVGQTLQHPKLTKILQDMYASGESRRYAREAIISAAIINVLSKRRVITEEEFDEGLESVLMEAS